MTVLLVYATFIVLVFVLLIIITYFVNNLIRRNNFDAVVAREIEKMGKIFNNHMKKDDFKRLNKNQIKSLQETVLTKKGLVAFNTCYNNYIEKNGYSDKLQAYVDMIIDYRVIHNNHVVRERYKDSYTLYLLSLYKITSKEALDYAYQCLDHSSLYSRNNALRVIQNSTDESVIIKALKALHTTKYYFNNKIIIDFLTEFKGNKSKLTEALINDMDSFNEEIKLIIIDYFTSVSDINAKSKIFEVLDSDYSLEFNLAAIKYFGKVISEEAYQIIFECLDDKQWEIRAICAKVIERYGNKRVIDKLKEKLSDKNWFVRFNSAISLINLNNGTEKEEILKIKDNYAREIYIYALFSKGIIRIREYNRLIEKVLQEDEKELKEMLLNKDNKIDNKKIRGRKVKKVVGV